MKEYQCNCGNTVYTDAQHGPGPIRWNDGHTCNLKPVNMEEEHEFSKHSENS